MKIVCIRLATTTVYGQQSHDIHTAPHGMLSVSFVGIIADLIDAEHQVNWIERPLCPASIDATTSEVAYINPDVLLFASDGHWASPLMATVAVRYDKFSHGQYLCDGLLRPASQWCEALSKPEMTSELLIDKLIQYREAGVGRSATNDSCRTRLV